jgi:salicylate hydroxylase
VYEHLLKLLSADKAQSRSREPGSASELHVGICGAGISGRTATIAIQKTCCKVSLLEAAKELGEVGAKIQMKLNVARLLIDRGVDKIVG